MSTSYEVSGSSWPASNSASSAFTSALWTRSSPRHAASSSGASSWIGSAVVSGGEAIAGQGTEEVVARAIDVGCATATEEDPMAGTEFWRELKPIENVFKPHALPDVYLSD